MGISVTIIIVLIILSGFFSATEIAYFSLSPAKFQLLTKRKSQLDKTIIYLKEHPQRLLTTILIGNNVVNVAVATLTTLFAEEFYGSKWIGLAGGILTFVLLAFGEILPKSLAIKNAKFFILLSAYPLKLMEAVFYPVVILFEKLIKAVEREDYLPAMTAEELKIMAQLGVKEGVVEEEERQMIYNILEFDEVVVKDIMVPINKIVSLEANMKVKDAIKRVNSEAFSRFPIYEDEKTNIIGIVHVKKLLGIGADKKIKEVAFDTFYIPLNQPIDDLLHDFKEKRVHIALVVNEHGEVRGLVTLEDVLEELVGEIEDETDKRSVKKRIVKRSGNNIFQISGTTPIDMLNSKFKLKIPTEEGYTTLSGFVMHHLEKIPGEGEKFIYCHYEFTIKKASPSEILLVELKKH